MGNDHQESVGDIVRRRLGSRGLRRIAHAAHICFIANELSLGRYVAIRYRDGVLTLRVTNAVALDELTLEVHQLTQTIKARLSWPADQSLLIKLVLLTN